MCVPLCVCVVLVWSSMWLRDAADPHKKKRATIHTSSSSNTQKETATRLSLYPGPQCRIFNTVPFVIRQGDKTTYGTGPGFFQFWHALALRRTRPALKATHTHPSLVAWMTPRWVSPRYCKSRSIQARISSFGMSAPSSSTSEVSFLLSVSTGGVGRAGGGQPGREGGAPTDGNTTMYAQTMASSQEVGKR